MNTNLAGIKAGRVLFKTVLVNNIQKVVVVIGVKQTIKIPKPKFSAICKI